jgi:hypothetical protein
MVGERVVTILNPELDWIGQPDTWLEELFPLS